MQLPCVGFVVIEILKDSAQSGGDTQHLQITGETVYVTGSEPYQNFLMESSTVSGPIVLVGISDQTLYNPKFSIPDKYVDKISLNSQIQTDARGLKSLGKTTDDNYISYTNGQVIPENKLNKYYRDNLYNIWIMSSQTVTWGENSVGLKYSYRATLGFTGYTLKGHINVYHYVYNKVDSEYVLDPNPRVIGNKIPWSVDFIPNPGPTPNPLFDVHGYRNTYVYVKFTIACPVATTTPYPTTTTTPYPTTTTTTNPPMPPKTTTTITTKSPNIMKCVVNKCKTLNF